MKNLGKNQKEERPRADLISTRGLVAEMYSTLVGEPRRVRELHGTREEPEGHPERGEPTDSEHRQSTVGDRRDESRFATEEVERLGLAEGRDQPGQHETHAHDCHQRRSNLQELGHDYTSVFEFGMCDRATIARFRTVTNIAYMGLKVKDNRKSPYFRAFSGFLYWIKKFSFPRIKIWFAPMFFSGLFCGFERCGSAAFRIFRGEFSPPAAAKWVRTNSRIEHHLGNCKLEIPASLRSAVKTYWILGSKMNWRFCIRGKENFLILNS